jgi:hypothetical protein
MNFIQAVERLCKARDVPVVKLDVSVRPLLALLLGGLAKCFLVQQFGSVSTEGTDRKGGSLGVSNPENRLICQIGNGASIASEIQVAGVTFVL